jgi:hypothetical protein
MNQAGFSITTPQKKDAFEAIKQCKSMGKTVILLEEYILFICPVNVMMQEWIV